MPQWMFKSPKKRQFISFGYGTLRNDGQDEQIPLRTEITRRVGKKAVSTLKSQLKSYAIGKLKDILRHKK